MHVLIVTDLEGISCVDSIDMIPENNEGYQRAREYLMADTNAAIEGAIEGGATKITVIDGHGGGNNFIPGLLDKRAEKMMAGDYTYHTPHDYDAILCVGFHAMAGTENAFLDHTQNSTLFFDFRINGVPCGELAQSAYTQGVYGIPVVMLSGDAAACREAEALIPGIATACVKQADGRNKAICLPQAEALDRIRRAAADGVRRYKEIRPCELKLPAEISLTYCRNDYCDRFMRPGLERHGRTVTKIIRKVENYADLAIM